MPLPIRDGNQSLTTLSTILVSNSHVPAHTVVSLGAQAITDIATAVSGVELGPNTLNALENITVTLGQVTITGGLTDTQLRASAVTIGGSVTATISGTASVTFGTAVVTGSVSILNFPATQTVTFGQAPVTFGTAVITGSTSILNFPATQTVTFTQSSVTFGEVVVTGSTSIIGTPSVTFTQASVTFGQSSITGSVSVLNLPATQTVTFTQASVTFSQPTITGSVSVLNFPASQSVTFTTATVTFGTAVITGSTSILNFPATQTVTFSEAPVTFGLIAGTVTANPTGTQTIAGTVTANAFGKSVNSSTNYQIPIIGYDEDITSASDQYVVPVQISSLNGSVGSSNPLPISGTVTIGAGTAQIGSVTASISNSLTISSLPAISGTVTANLANVVTTDSFWGTQAIKVTGGNGYGIDIAGVDSAGNRAIFDEGGGIPVYPRDNVAYGASFPISGTVTAVNHQGTTVTTSNFTSTTPSTVLASFNSGREVLTIFNEGAGNLHICAGATCTTIAYQVRLSAGDYYEVPLNQTSLTHSAVFATAGTARIVQIS